MTLPRGGVNDSHVLIAAISHAPSMATSHSDVLHEVERYKRGLRDLFASQGLCLVLFERFLRGVGPAHAHIQAIGVPTTAAARAASVLESEAHKVGMAFQVLHEGQSLESVAGDDDYFYAEVPSPEDSMAVVHGRAVTSDLTSTAAAPRTGAYRPVRFFHKCVEG